MRKQIDDQADDILLTELTPEQRAKLGELLNRGIECNFRVLCEHSDSDSTVIARGNIVGWEKVAIKLVGGVGMVTIELTDEQLLEAIKQVMSSSDYLVSSIKVVLDEVGVTHGQD